MSMLAADFLLLAKGISSQPGEAHQRTSISRAYYAAYHWCKDWHAALPAPGSAGSQQGGAHQVLISQLLNPAPELTAELKRKSKMIGYALQDLRAKRTLADYYLAETIDATLPAMVCGQVEKLCT